LPYVAFVSARPRAQEEMAARERISRLWRFKRTISKLRNPQLWASANRNGSLGYECNRN
jgi:hypothetical protein